MSFLQWYHGRGKLYLVHFMHFQNWGVWKTQAETDAVKGNLRIHCKHSLDDEVCEQNLWSSHLHNFKRCLKFLYNRTIFHLLTNWILVFCKSNEPNVFRIISSGWLCPERLRVILVNEDYFHNVSIVSHVNIRQ